MNQLNIRAIASAIALLSQFATLDSVFADGLLTSGEYFITQTWSQEKNYPRPYYVHIPESTESGKLPVFIFLHGNGGNAKGSMSGFMRRHPNMSKRYIMVFAEGYQKSWNIVSERSKADDRGFIESIVKKLATCQNV